MSSYEVRDDSFLLSSGRFTINGIEPSEGGENRKVKVKVRVNIHGVFVVSSATVVEKVKEAEGEPMETGGEQTETTDGDKSAAEPMDSEQASGKDEEKQEKVTLTPHSRDVWPLRGAYFQRFALPRRLRRQRHLVSHPPPITKRQKPPSRPPRENRR